MGCDAEMIMACVTGGGGVKGTDGGRRDEGGVSRVVMGGTRERGLSRLVMWCLLLSGRCLFVGWLAGVRGIGNWHGTLARKFVYSGRLDVHQGFCHIFHVI